MKTWKQILLASLTALVVSSPAIAQDDKRWKDKDKEWKDQNKRWEDRNKRMEERDKRWEDRDKRLEERNRRREQRVRNDQNWDGNRRRGRGQMYPYSSLSIPPGHLPPPGECRVWYPDRPAGHQPPPQPCGTTPPGAWVVTHEGDRYRVNMYNANRGLSGIRYYLAR